MRMRSLPSRTISSSCQRRAAAIFACGLARSAVVAAPGADSSTQDIQYIWPTVVWQAGLFNPAEADNEQDAGLTKRLAAIAEEGFRDFVKDILPLQLAGDPAYRARYEASDATTRDSEAFSRWQKMTFARRKRIPLEEVNWLETQPPNVKGIRYDWKDLYHSKDFKRLSQNILHQCFKLLKHVSREGFEKEPFRLFVWAEVYRPGEFNHPHVRTGAMAAGLFAAGNGGPESSRQTLTLSDTRGYTAPFGNRHEVVLDEGELIAFPAWMPQQLRPHPGNETNVFFGFLMWPPGGTYDFDWEDDPLGDYVYAKTTQIKRAAHEDRTEL